MYRSRVYKQRGAGMLAAVLLLALAGVAVAVSNGVQTVAKNNQAQAQLATSHTAVDAIDESDKTKPVAAQQEGLEKECQLGTVNSVEAKKEIKEEEERTGVSVEETPGADQSQCVVKWCNEKGACYLLGQSQALAAKKACGEDDKECFKEKLKELGVSDEVADGFASKIRSELTSTSLHNSYIFELKPSEVQEILDSKKAGLDERLNEIIKKDTHTTEEINTIAEIKSLQNTLKAQQADLDRLGSGEVRLKPRLDPGATDLKNKEGETIPPLPERKPSTFVLDEEHTGEPGDSAAVTRANQVYDRRVKENEIEEEKLRAMQGFFCNNIVEWTCEAGYAQQEKAVEDARNRVVEARERLEKAQQDAGITTDTSLKETPAAAPDGKEKAPTDSTKDPVKYTDSTSIKPPVKKTGCDPDEVDCDTGGTGGEKKAECSAGEVLIGGSCVSVKSDPDPPRRQPLGGADPYDFFRGLFGGGLSSEQCQQLGQQCLGMAGSQQQNCLAQYNQKCQGGNNSLGDLLQNLTGNNKEQTACSQWPGTTFNKNTNRCECPNDQEWAGSKCEASGQKENTKQGELAAEISCAPKVQDVGEPVLISYTCTGASTSRGESFETGGDLSGSATVNATFDESAIDKRVRTFALTCIKEGRTHTDSCTVQVNSPTVTAIAVPDEVAAGETAKIAWITTGIKSCTLSAPGGGAESDEFNKTNAPVNSASGRVVTPKLSEALTVEVSCTTFGGAEKKAEVEVKIAN